MKKGVAKSRYQFRGYAKFNKKTYHLGSHENDNLAHSAVLYFIDLINHGYDFDKAKEISAKKFNNPISFIQQNHDSFDLEKTEFSVFISTHSRKDSCELIGVELKHLDSLIEALIEIKNSIN
jgi:hypothetical protein